MLSSTTLIPLLLLPLLSSASPTKAKFRKPTVTIDSGPIIGSQTVFPDSPNRVVDKYLGIPFAAPPPRFSPPVEPEPWTRPKRTTEFYPACPQQFSRNPEAVQQWFNTPAPPESEDCLGLNVFAPARPKKGRWGEGKGKGKGKGKDEDCDNEEESNGKAVLFWIYGGGLQFGQGGNRAYDGSSFAANQDVIVVTINYRTNIFGFPNIPGLPVGENNLGFLDQRLALDWVQRNIAKFGGDPDRVTIFGQSAGALSVDALVTQPPDPVPFNGAIYMSGQVSLRAANPNPYQGWADTLELTNCTDAEDEIACVTAVPFGELEGLISVNAVNFVPISDNITLSSTSREDRLVSTPESSKIARVPVLGGSTAEEGATYALAYNDTRDYIAVTFPTATPEQTETLLDTFAIGTPGISNTFDQITAMITHQRYQCTYSIISKDIQAAGIPSWRYYWNASFENLQLFEGSGVYHASEIQPVFGTVLPNSTEFQFELSAFVQKTWADFAKDPAGGPGWDEIPEVDNLGGGYRFDSGEEDAELLTLVDQDVVDQRCAAIFPFYNLDN